MNAIVKPSLQVAWRVNGMLIDCERADIYHSVVVYVKAPYEMSDNAVANALIQYGTVVNIRRQHHLFDDNIENGVRSLLIKHIKKPIPSFVRVGNFNLPVRHRGQEKTCKICQKPGHMARDCDQRGRCFICGSKDHRADAHDKPTDIKNMRPIEEVLRDTSDEENERNGEKSEGKEEEEEEEGGGREEEEQDDDEEEMVRETQSTNDEEVYTQIITEIANQKPVEVSQSQPTTSEEANGSGSIENTENNKGEGKGEEIGQR